MSRSGYNEDGDIDNWQRIMWRGRVASAIKGKRGQAFLREMIEALDAMPDRRLIVHELRKDGEVCALGAVGAKRGVDLESIDPYDHKTLASTFNIAPCLVQEIEYENDIDLKWMGDTPETRWVQMRGWAVKHLKTIS